MPRVSWQASETAGVSTTSTSTWTDILSLDTGSLDPAKDYLLLADVMFETSVGDEIHQFRVYDATDAASLIVEHSRDRNTSERGSMMMGLVFSPSASGPHTIKVQERSGAGASVTGYANLLIIELDSADSWSSSTPESSSTSTTYATKVSHSFTPGDTGEEFLVLAICQAAASNRGRTMLRLMVDGAEQHRIDREREASVSDAEKRLGSLQIARVTGKSASVTVELQYASYDGVETAKIRNAYIAVLKALVGQRVVAGIARSQTTTTGTTYTTKNSLQVSNVGTSFLYFSGASILTDSTWTDVQKSRILANGVEDFIERRPRPDNPSLSYRRAIAQARRYTPSSTDVTLEFQWATFTGSTTGAEESVIAALYEDTSGIRITEGDDFVLQDTGSPTLVRGPVLPGDLLFDEQDSRQFHLVRRNTPDEPLYPKGREDLSVILPAGEVMTTVTTIPPEKVPVAIFLPGQIGTAEIALRVKRGSDWLPIWWEGIEYRTAVTTESVVGLNPSPMVSLTGPEAIRLRFSATMPNSLSITIRCVEEGL